MQPTAYPSVNHLLQRLLSDLQHTLGDDLLALYLYGSLLLGNFDQASDVDLLAITRETLNDGQVAALTQMHAALVEALPQWTNRLEVAYVGQLAMQRFKTHHDKIGRISPGEPLNMRVGGIDFLIDWYMVQETGITLYGATHEQYLPIISQDEFLAVIRNTALNEWRERLQAPLDYYGQSYALLTLSRSLYTLTHRQQVGKRDAVQWLAQQLPQWATLLQQALAWRAGQQPQADPASTLAQTRELATHIMMIIAANSNF